MELNKQKQENTFTKGAILINNLSKLKYCSQMQRADVRQEKLLHSY